MSDLSPVQDVQTVTADGERVGRRIDGLVIRRCPTMEDERGDLVEVFRGEWGVHPAPLVYVYAVTMAPGSIRGWVMHRKQDDRIFVHRGPLQWAFYDDRPDSPTRGLLNKFTWSEMNRVLFVIPAGVYHAVKNVGPHDGLIINMPSRPDDHADPDRYRLSLSHEKIPYPFGPDTRG